MTDLPAALNGGWIYRERVAPSAAGQSLCAYYAAHQRHSDQATWQRRLAAGEIEWNGQRLQADVTLAAGDRLAWHRPPWWEGAVPASWRLLLDDGDLLVLDKPSGLPVLPAGGWLEHTVMRLLEQRHQHDPAGIPRPVHRLGRFTSGLLVCARQPATRAWLSQRLRESTAAGADAGGAAATGGCDKVYRALLAPGLLTLAPGERQTITVAIGRRAHPLLGSIWCAADGSGAGDLAARSELTVLERRDDADLVEVAIATGRPHQIRIHCAAFGAPLLGDPLYAAGGLVCPGALPGDGGYQLHALRLRLLPPEGGPPLELLAPPPAALRQHRGPEG